MTKKGKKCAVCGKSSPVIICEQCSSNIQAESVGEKKKLEKGVNVGSEVLADKAARHKN